jgi:hypothetical protein
MSTGNFEGGAYHATLTAATVTTGGAVLSLANPEGADIYVTRLIIKLTTVATGAGAIDAGIGATAATSDDTLIDGLDVHSAVGVFDNLKNAGTHGLAGVKWASDKFLTITASATLAGMVAEAIIEYVPL